MFLRTVKVRRADGHIDEYVRLVESVWRKGRPEHRVISNLGRKDLLAPHAATLLRMLTGEHPPALRNATFLANRSNRVITRIAPVLRQRVSAAASSGR